MRKLEGRNTGKITIQIKKPEKTVLLSMGGMDNLGNRYQVDNLSLIRNGKRILPVMGEFHFSRYEPQAWEEELLKMKSGGIDIVSTYIFWIHHEERQGEWNFEGCRDLRRFLQTCQDVGLYVWLRIGPWAHGECRNGGFPDWVAQEKSFEVRTNAPEYLTWVKAFYGKLGEQTRGMMCKDGGPVIGVQLENEYGHCGGPAERKRGLEHMHMLKQLAIEAGFEVPYYSATGWGSYYNENETLPMLGGYVDAPWAEHVEKAMPRKGQLFEPFSEDKSIGADLSRDKPEETSEKDEGIHQRGPYLTAELGGGIQVTSHRRTYPWPADTEAQALCVLGSGCSLPGYYMYHGGINPDGKYSTLQESRETGYNNDLPVKSYDFMACIRESGEIGESYGRLKKMHLLLHDFGEEMAGGEVSLPEKLPESVSDAVTLRAAARINPETGGGFLFLNNHQRYVPMVPKENVTVAIENEKELLEIDQINVADGECRILPFHLKVGDAFLEKTNASLLCMLGNRVFFYTEEAEPYFQWRGEPADTVILTTAQANRAFKIGGKLYITEKADSCLVEENGNLFLLTKQTEEKVLVYGPVGTPQILTLRVENIGNEITADTEVVLVQKDEGGVEYKDYMVNVGYFNREQVNQVYMEIDYLGDRAEIYSVQDGENAEEHLLDDWFTNGELWHAALRRFDYPHQMKVRIYPSDRPLPNPYQNRVFYDLPVENGCEIRSVRMLKEYKLPLK